MNGTFCACVKLTSDGWRFFLQDFVKPQYRVFQVRCHKKRRESAHARILEGILNGELRACVDSRRFFVTTDLKNPVQGFSSWLSKNRDENPRMRALLVGILN